MGENNTKLGSFDMRGLRSTETHCACRLGSYTARADRGVQNSNEKYYK